MSGTGVVATANGRVQGSAGDGVFSFLGIPYGAPTGGAARFLPPEPPAPWEGTRPATRMGPRCPQPPLPSTPLFTFSTDPLGEDCLVLNVWTPDPSPAARQPVMVFLHGGAYSFGSANDPVYEGANLARGEGVVVVTLNHRLNVFGFPGAFEGAAANAGLLDLVLALQWVQENIAAFGGDPGNVTLLGHSGGSGKVAALLAMPAARGLFHKAVMQSGPVMRVHTPEQAEAVSARVLSQIGMEYADLRQLQALPAAQLVDAAAQAGLMAFQPMADGDTLPGQLEDQWPMDVPLMIGCTHDEATAMCLPDPQWRTLSESDLLARITTIAGPQGASALLEKQRRLTPNMEPMYLWSAILTRLSFHEPTLAIAERWAGVGRAPVYVYRMDWKSPFADGLLRSPHGIELPFLFRNRESSRDLLGSGDELSMMMDTVSRSFASFARGVPALCGETWLPFAPNWRNLAVLDVAPRQEAIGSNFAGAHDATGSTP